MADNTQNTGQNKSDKNADVVNVVKDNQQPATNNQQPITNKEEPIVNKEQPLVNKEEPTANKELPIAIGTTNNEQPTNKEQPVTNKEQPIVNKEEPTNNQPPIAIGAITNNQLSEDEYNSVIKSSDYNNYNSLREDAKKRNSKVRQNEINLLFIRKRVILIRGTHWNYLS